ncbi:ketopantoate reductase family protein [Pontibacter rugosus]|uniref:2-dehydropantoate 2-reductase n=1 Tax=Pontibacter rugosus TaxID=1745966 RepID=A0ABW3SQ69_9BACT
MDKYKIAVVGIGGVGGYYGGKLAKRYADDPGYEITFIARGDHKSKIEKEGLRLELEEGTAFIHPSKVVETPQQLGKQDLIIFCVKSYSLEQVAEQFETNITPATVLLPLLNGVDGIEYLQNRYPEAQTLWGCVYIVSSKTAPGVVKVQGKYNRLVWGNPKLPAEVLQRVKALFEDAGINQEFYDDVENKVWEKFAFISPVASLSSLSDKTMGQLVGQDDLRQQLINLMQEIKLIAAAKGVELPENIVEQNLKVVEKLPHEATSSMQRDFREGNRTELENLTGYIVREGEKAGISTPTYAEVYQQLKHKSI